MQQPAAGGAGGSQTHYGGAGEMSAAEAAAAEQGQLVVEAASPISSRPPASAAVNLDELMTLSGTAAAAEDAFADRGGGGGSSGNRWPRQETLALLKIRSDMDVAFRDATLKGPLWEDVSRKLAELGYQRNAKKCKEKFENVHKYYKRTKEGRAGRQDGKSYKFFSEMGALHGTAATAAATTANVSASPAVHVASPNPVSVGLGSVSNPMPISSFSMSQQQQPPPVTAIPIIPSSQPTASPMDFNFSSNSSSTSPGTDDEDDDDDVEGERSSRKRKRGSASTSTGISGGGRTRKMMDFSEVLMKQVMQKQESSSSPSSSSSSPYDVFLSFSEDTRKTFTDHLYWTMKDAGIDFFMEENESIRRGENISDKVKQRIEGSKVSVVVFSSRYADSIWCLEELVQVMECRRTLKQMVLPIFYDLSPSDVIGTFVLAFQKHRERFHEDTDIQEKLRRWTDALTAAAFMAVWTDTLTAAAGFTVRVFRTTNGYEGRFIRAIIDEITSLLQSPTPIEIAFTDLQGIDSPELALYLLSSALSPLSTPPGKLDSPELALSPPGNLDSPELALSLMSGAKSPLSTPPGKNPRSRSSQYRGVTFYRRTGRWESHIWDCGKQVYLGGFDTAHAAARAYDRAAIKFRGIEADINFSVSDYEDDIKQMSNFTKEEFVHILRRQSTGFSRGSSKFRGVTLHKCGRWEARMGQFLGKKAYDKAAIKCNGREVVTNFDRSSYDGEIASEANNEGSHQSLDLNLGIAPPLVSEIQKENMNLRSFPFQLGCNDIPVHLRARNEISVPAPMRSHLSHGSIVASKEPPIMSNMNSSFFPIHMERATEKSMDVNSFPNWAWQLQGLNGGATSMPLFSAAASSGFPSSTATSSSSAVTQLHFPNTAILRHHFSPSFTNNIPHFYCRS